MLNTSISDHEHEINSIQVAVHKMQDSGNYSAEALFSLQQKLDKILSVDVIEGDLRPHFIALQKYSSDDIHEAINRWTPNSLKSCASQFATEMAVIQAAYVASVIGCNAVLPCQLAALAIKIGSEAAVAQAFANCNVQEA